MGFCPRDHALGLAGSSLSPAVTRMVGTAAAMVSFAESSASSIEVATGLPAVAASQTEPTTSVGPIVSIAAVE